MIIKINIILSLLFVIIFFSLIQAQETNEIDTNINTVKTEKKHENPNAPHFHFSINYSEMGIYTTDYNSIRFQPDFSIGKFDIMLDINFSFDTNGDFVNNDWNIWQAIVSKILYIKYGNKGEPLYIKIGGIEDYTYANGLIFNLYSDRLTYPSLIKEGLVIDLNLNNFGIESMADNILDFDILGLRGFYRPLYGIGPPMLDKLEIGATVAADLDPQNPIPLTNMPYNFTDTNSGQNVLIYGADLNLPVFDIKALSISTYGEFAGINNKGTGEIFGLKGRFISFIPFKAEYQVYQPKFIPSYFDIFYDTTRYYKYNILDLYTNDYIGWKANSGISLFDDKLSWIVEYEDSFNDSANTKPTLSISINLAKALLKKASFKFLWLRENISNIIDAFTIIDGDTAFIADFSYYISDNISLSWYYKRVFTIDNYLNILPFMTSIISTTITF